MPIPSVFVVGVPRSGTTLLQRMLNSHPELAVANDTHFIPRALEKVDPLLIAEGESGNPIPLVPELVSATLNYHRFYRMGLTEPEVLDAAQRANDYAEFISNLYRQFAANAGKYMAGEKTPDYVRRIPLLAGMFPGASLIHIIRDGRAVALSLLDWATGQKGPGKIGLWREQPVAVSALWWSWMIESGRSAAKTLSADSYFEIHYESLVEHPEDTMREAADAISLEFDPAMLKFNAGKTKRKSGLSAKSAWLPPQTGLRDWRQDMPGEKIELFEAIAGELLSSLGYPRMFPSISSSARQLADDCLQWWQTHFVSRHTAPLTQR